MHSLNPIKKLSTFRWSDKFFGLKNIFFQNKFLSQFFVSQGTLTVKNDNFQVSD